MKNLIKLTQLFILCLVMCFSSCGKPHGEVWSKHTRVIGGEIEYKVYQRKNIIKDTTPQKTYYIVSVTNDGDFMHGDYVVSKEVYDSVNKGDRLVIE